MGPHGLRVFFVVNPLELCVIRSQFTWLTLYKHVDTEAYSATTQMVIPFILDPKVLGRVGPLYFLSLDDDQDRNPPVPPVVHRRLIGFLPDVGL